MVKKTSVYLDAAEQAALKRASDRTGRSQSELIRAGIRAIVDEQGRLRREFRSMGMGHGVTRAAPGWDADDLYDRRLGRRD